MAFFSKIIFFYVFLFEAAFADLLSGCIEEHIDYAGNDIAVYYGVDNYEDCHAYCKLTRKCEAFSHWERFQECHLKTNKKGRRDQKGVYSGRKNCCVEYTIDYEGGDIGHTKYVANWEECRILCQVAWPWRCTLWSYSGTDKTCRKKNRYGKRVPKRDYWSGVPNCPSKHELPTTPEPSELPKL